VEVYIITPTSHYITSFFVQKQVEIDFLMTILKQRLSEYPHLRLVIFLYNSGYFIYLIIISFSYQ
jgi:HrpA-like RNA helicase